LNERRLDNGGPDRRQHRHRVLMRILRTHFPRCRTRTVGLQVFAPDRWFGPNGPFRLTASPWSLLPFALLIPVSTAAAASVASGTVAAGITGS
jgi:hypothetical protein